MAYKKGVITIPNVSGNISITVTTAAKPFQQNLFDKNDPNVVLRGRLNSSGGIVAYADGQLVTGYIEAYAGDTITVITDKANNTNGYTGMVDCYLSDNEHITQAGNGNASWVWSDDHKTGVFTIPSIIQSHDVTNMANIRLCVAYEDIDNIAIYVE